MVYTYLVFYLFGCEGMVWGLLVLVIDFGGGSYAIVLLLFDPHAEVAHLLGSEVAPATSG